MPRLSTVHLPTDSAGQFSGPCPLGEVGWTHRSIYSSTNVKIVFSYKKQSRHHTQQISLGFNIYTNPRLLFSISSINRSNFSRKKHTSKRPDNGFQIKDRQSPHWRWSQPRVRISIDFVSEKIGESN